jgi:hypothetical protein
MNQVRDSPDWLAGVPGTNPPSCTRYNLSYLYQVQSNPNVPGTLERRHSEASQNRKAAICLIHLSENSLQTLSLLSFLCIYGDLG